MSKTQKQTKKNWRFDIRIGTLIFLGFLLVTAISVFSIGYLSFYNAETALRQASLSGLHVIAEGRSSDIVHLIQLRQEQAKELAGTFLLRQLESSGENDPEDAARIQVHIDSILEELKIDTSIEGAVGKSTAIKSIGVYDIAGRFIANTNKELAHQKIPNKYLESVKNKEFSFGGLVTDPATEEKTLIFLQQIRDFEDDDFSGIVMLSVEAEIFGEIMDNLSGLGETGEVLLGQRDPNAPNSVQFISKLRHTETPSVVLLGSDVAIPVQEAVQGNDGEGLSIDYRGEEIFAVWKALPELGWGMVVKFDVDEAFVSVNRLKVEIALFGAVLFLFMIFFASVIGKRITGPINTLQKDLEIIEKGNLDHRVGYEGGGEIGQFARAFDKMTAVVKQSRADVDKKVEMQTKEIVLQQQKTDEINKSLHQLNQSMVGRELKMIELKEKIAKLEHQINK